MPEDRLDHRMAEAAIEPGHVLFAIGSFDVGGAESQLANLAEELVRRGWRVEVFAIWPNGALRERLLRAGVVISGNPARRRSTAFRAFRVAGRGLHLAWRIATTRPDVVHGFLPLPNCMAAVAGRLAFAPLVITSRRNVGDRDEQRPRLRWLNRVASALSHVVTANSRAVATDVNVREGYDRGEIVVIPNGLDLRRFEPLYAHRDEIRRELGLAAGEVALVKVANIAPHKGHDDLIEAFAAIARRRPSLKLFLVGEDRGAAAGIARAVARRQLGGRVILLGYRADVPRLLSGMDVGVAASHEEGLSTALIEELAAGLPIVATAVGGNAEIIDGVPDCILVAARDPLSLAAGIEQVVSALPAVAERRGERQAIARDRYSLSEMVSRYERLYRSKPC